MMSRGLIIFVLLLVTTAPGSAQDYSRQAALNIDLNLDYLIDRDLNFKMGNGYLPNYDFKRIQNLAGRWKFELGDDEKWASSKFNDSQWEEIMVPSSWEDEGFPGYDGYAWYRTHFTVDPEYQDSRIYLYLGYIDDVDEVFVNGHFVGFTGSLPPDVKMADYMLRRYLLPPEFLDFKKENVLAVRVYDHRLIGGIVRGKIGLYVIRNEFVPDLRLDGYWDFKTGDDEQWREMVIADHDWEKIKVPLHWEVQGYRDYDGFAWYRKKFILPDKFKNEKLILLLGIIDDLDEAYINGHLIGRTGLIHDDVMEIDLENYWRELRAYFLPKSYLRFNDENVIAVRVYDGLVKGGIYDGPIGIVTRERFIRWQDKGVGNFFIKILEKLLGE